METCYMYLPWLEQSWLLDFMQQIKSPDDKGVIVRVNNDETQKSLLPSMFMYM